MPGGRPEALQIHLAGREGEWNGEIRAAGGFAPTRVTDAQRMVIPG